MSLCTVVEIALQFESFRNIDLFHQGGLEWSKLHDTWLFANKSIDAQSNKKLGGLYHLKTRIYRDDESRALAVPYSHLKVWMGPNFSQRDLQLVDIYIFIIWIYSPRWWFQLIFQMGWNHQTSQIWKHLSLDDFFVAGPNDGLWANQGKSSASGSSQFDSCASQRGIVPLARNLAKKSMDP